jgi:hypothetical protein
LYATVALTRDVVMIMSQPGFECQLELLRHPDTLQMNSGQVKIP